MSPLAVNPYQFRATLGVVVLVFLLVGNLGTAWETGAGAHPAAPVRGEAAPSLAALGPGSRAPTPVSPPRIHSAPLQPLQGGGVDPYAFLQSEPASLGITDYGVNGVGDGYTYSTPVWWANSNISRLLAYYPADTEGDGDLTFQLNVVLKLTSPTGVPYAFWIQDVVDVDTVGKAIEFLDNVWNLSSSAGTLQPSGSITGNGSEGSYGSGYFYGDSPPCQGSAGGYPGNCVKIEYPYLLTERVTSGEVDGTPHVSFQYDTGAGWVTYDNVSFPFAHGFTDHDFTVDGTQYTPLGLFYDAEWDYTGPPGGSIVDRNTSMNMQLEYWNGHNLQAPPNAYNFGSDTGESIQNVVSAAEYNSTNGSVGAHVTTGAGDLGPLYYSTDVATLGVGSPDVADGTITIGGAAHPYTGNRATFTLGPGSYNVSLWDSGSFVGGELVTLSAGADVQIELGYPVPFPVDFVEKGLTGGVAWNLTVSGISYPNAGTATELELTNGTYNYSVAPVPGFTLPAYQGAFTVDGQPVTVYFNFTTFLFAVTASETGLPAGTSWWFDLDGATLTESVSSIVFREPNGTYPYTDGAGVAYTASPSASTAVVSGASDFELISFALNPGFLTGQVTPGGAAVYVGGSAEPTTDGAFNVTLLPGLYTVEVTASGYNASWTNVTVSPGRATTLALTLNATPRSPPVGNSSPASTGLSTGEAEIIVGVAAAAAAAGIGTAVWLGRRGRR